MKSMLAFTTAVIAFAAFLAYPAEELDVAPAMTNAAAWLAAVDGGQYGKSWDDAAASLKEAMPKAKWETALEGARGPLGGLVVRKLRSATYAKDPPGAPPGEYVVIQYDTRFDNRPVAFETVTPMKEKDGTWRVAGYYIK
jgi:hypothetical protein